MSHLPRRDAYRIPVSTEPTIHTLVLTLLGCFLVVAIASWLVGCA